MPVDTQENTKTIICTTVFSQLMDAWLGGKRRFFVEGGTTTSKSYSFLQFLYFVLPNSEKPLLATITSESTPHLKHGVMRDWLKIMGDELIESRWNRTDFIYTWPNGSQLEFVSGDHAEKFSGPRRDIWWANELPNLSKNVYQEADMRTGRFTMGDWNPYSEFWFHDDFIMKDPETGEFIVDPVTHSARMLDSSNIFISGLTYNDVIRGLPYEQATQVVSPSVIQTIESYKDKDPNYYRVHGLGLLGKLGGLVYPNFKQVDELPDGKVFYGLDYGFSSDPTVLTRHVVIGENLYSQEVFYDYNGMTNDDIARECYLKGVKKEPIYADANEPKSAAELTKLGLNVMPVDKAFFRMTYRIQKVNQYYQHWTKDSLNCIKEQRNYRYVEDKEHRGRFTDKTTHQWSHGMSSREFAVVMMRTEGDSRHHSLSRGQALRVDLDRHFSRARR